MRKQSLAFLLAIGLLGGTLGFFNPPMAYAAEGTVQVWQTMDESSSEQTDWQVLHRLLAEGRAYADRWHGDVVLADYALIIRFNTRDGQTLDWLKQWFARQTEANRLSVRSTLAFDPSGLSITLSSPDEAWLQANYQKLQQIVNH